ncbi:MAG: hypothetical protein JEZ11_00345 [Desulfobacterales bacterium]|nr:hypothetical protein [Desulfobacterales bacterium]
MILESITEGEPIALSYPAPNQTGIVKRAWNQGRLETVRHELRNLKHRMVACHREFK